MPTVTESATIDASPQAVWDLVTDLSRYDDWLKIHAGFSDGTPEQITVGATFTQKVKIMGMPGEVDWTVTEVTAPERASMTGAGPMGIVLVATYVVSQQGDGSRITMESDLSGGALDGPLGKTIARHSGKSARESLNALSGLL